MLWLKLSFSFIVIIYGTFIFTLLKNQHRFTQLTMFSLFDHSTTDTKNRPKQEINHTRERTISKDDVMLQRLDILSDRVQNLTIDTKRDHQKVFDHVEKELLALSYDSITHYDITNAIDEMKALLMKEIKDLKPKLLHGSKKDVEPIGIRKDGGKSRKLVINMLHIITKEFSSFNNTGHVLIAKTDQIDMSNTYDLVITVMSYTPNFAQRETIRQKWADKKETFSKNWCLFFVTAGVEDMVTMKKLYKEIQEKKDVILIDSLEDYDFNLPQKDMAAFEWVHKNLKYSFLLKVDDDVFINIDELLTTIALKRNPKYLFMGHCYPKGASVSRTGKYRVTHQEYPHKSFPPYCSGGAYVLSKALLELIIPRFDWLTPLRIEDAYIGIKVNEVGKTVVNSVRFLMINDKCDYKKFLVASHPANALCMDKLMKSSRRDMSLVKRKYAIIADRNKKMNPKNNSQSKDLKISPALDKGIK